MLVHSDQQLGIIPWMSAEFIGLVLALMVLTLVYPVALFWRFVLATTASDVLYYYVLEPALFRFVATIRNKSV